MDVTAVKLPLKELRAITTISLKFVNLQLHFGSVAVTDDFSSLRNVKLCLPFVF